MIRSLSEVTFHRTPFLSTSSSSTCHMMAPEGNWTQSFLALLLVPAALGHTPSAHGTWGMPCLFASSEECLKDRTDDGPWPVHPLEYVIRHHHEKAGATQGTRLLFGEPVLSIGEVRQTRSQVYLGQPAGRDFLLGPGGWVGFGPRNRQG